MELKNKTVIVTGGADGLGLSVVKCLLEKGAIVHVVSRNVERHKQIMQEIQNTNLFTHQADVSKYSNVEKAVREIGNVDILINNAGVWLEGDLIKNSLENISRTIDINTKGVIYTTKAVLPAMLSKNKGIVLNISSTSGLEGRKKSSVYCASKWAVTGFTQSLKEDLKGTNVRVLGFYPGGMNTTLFSNAGNDKDTSKFMDPMEIAEIIIFILQRPEGINMDNVVVNRNK